MTACENCVVLGFWPQSRPGFPINWSMDGKSLFELAILRARHREDGGVALPVGYSARRVMALAGLRYEQDVSANTAATVINEANVFPAASASAHLSWRRTTHSNLYRVPLPD